MPHDLHAALKQHFGHKAFRAGQEQVMEALLAGRSALALFPTSAGKSLCYQLPALLMEGVTLVISRRAVCRTGILTGSVGVIGSDDG